MSLHADLLHQARQLARLELRRPRQASLRRAVSAAYYALFHLLIHDASRIMISNPDVRQKLSRAFDHGDMRAASGAFANPRGDLKKLTGGIPIPVDLQTVAATFVRMQDTRHEADYDLSRPFTRAEVNRLVADVDQAFRLWQSVKIDPASQAYLAALLLWKRWNR
jgi:uncharacterized protein (UPF0332 family)